MAEPHPALVAMQNRINVTEAMRAAIARGAWPRIYVVGIEEPKSPECQNVSPGAPQYPAEVCTFPAGHGLLYDDDEPFDVWEHGRKDSTMRWGWCSQEDIVDDIVKTGRLDVYGHMQPASTSPHAHVNVGPVSGEVGEHLPEQDCCEAAEIKAWDKAIPDEKWEAAKREYGTGALIDTPEDSSILADADALIHGDRNATYRHPLDNFEQTAKLWSAVLGVDVTPEAVGVCMILVKVARYAGNGYRWHRDTVTDIAGYAGTLQMVRDEKVRRGEA